MPTSPMKNLLYRAALPFATPRVANQLTLCHRGEALKTPEALRKLLCRHHVLGASVLLQKGEQRSETDASTLLKPQHMATPNSIYRVASITKMATALVTLRLCEQGAFRLDDAVKLLLPDCDDEAVLDGVTLRHLLSHTSGLRDLSACDKALQNGDTFHAVLHAPGVRKSAPGQSFAYCNFGFGLLGCVIERTTGLTVEDAFRQLLFEPLGMRATLDGSTLEADSIMEITRVLPFHPEQSVKVTPLGKTPLTFPDPTRHFGHTAGSLYTDAPSLSRLLTLLAQQGAIEGKQLCDERTIRDMTTVQASYGKLSPTLTYGLGLLFINDSSLSKARIIGHQGFAYGCVDGAFYEEGTGRQVISLNGGSSEARTGRLGLVNRDILRWGLDKEMAQWT